MVDNMKKEHNNIGLDANPPSNVCQDKKCPWHGNTKLRGKVFIAEVIKDTNKRSVVVQWSYNKFVPKYERYERRHTRITVHNPECIAAKKGDMVKVAECKPLSKTKHFVIYEKVENGE